MSTRGSPRRSRKWKIRARVKGELVGIPYLADQPSPAETSPPATTAAGSAENNKVDDTYRVTEGDQLFLIEPEKYDADVKMALAQRETAVAAEKRDAVEEARILALRDRNAASQSEFEAIRAQHASTIAAVNASEAQLLQAELNKTYTVIKAPFSGRVSRNLVDIGNLVGDGQSTHLATVTKYNPMYVNFFLNAKQLRGLREMLLKERTEKPQTSGKQPTAPLFIRAEGLDKSPRVGVFENFDINVDAGTGTFKVRGEFPNDSITSKSETTTGIDPFYLPGEFVRIRMPIYLRNDARVVSGVCPVGLHTGNHRPVVQTVRIDDRSFNHFQFD